MRNEDPADNAASQARRVSDYMEEACSRSRCTDCEGMVADVIREAENASRAKAFEEAAEIASGMAAHTKAKRAAELIEATANLIRARAKETPSNGS